MGQYYHVYTKNNAEELAWSSQCTNFVETRNFDWFIGHKLTEHSWYGNMLTDAVSAYIYKNPTQLAWVGDYARDAEVYNKCWANDDYTGLYHFTVNDGFDYTGKWAVNHTTKEAFPMQNPNPDEWIRYPISILTALGNGQGGGDYSGCNSMVGKWAMHVISIEDEAPKDYQVIPTPDF